MASTMTDSSLEVSCDSARVSPAWIFVALLLVLIFDPGLMTNDSLAMLKQARTLQFTDWHPPIMTMLWSLIEHIVEGPAGMLLAQVALYAYASAKLCAAAFPQLQSILPRWFVVSAYSLFPPAMAFIGVIWKDVWMSGLLLLGLAFLFILHSATTSQRRNSSALAVLIACFLATAFRHNSVAATAGLLAGVAYAYMPKWTHLLRLLAACASGVILALSFALAVSAMYRLIAAPAHVSTPILLHDIAGMIVRSGEPETAAKFALTVSPQITDDQDGFLAGLEKAYTPAAAIGVVRTQRAPDRPFSINVFLPDHDADSVKRAWAALVVRYPRAYIEHRAAAFACLMQLCGRKQWNNHSYVLNPKFALPKEVDPGSWRGVLRSAFLNPALSVLYFPLAWLLLACLGAIFGALNMSSRLGTLLFVGLSAIGLAVSLFFTSPIESYRYVHWVVLSGWTTALLLVDYALQKRRHAVSGVTITTHRIWRSRRPDDADQTARHS